MSVRLPPTRIPETPSERPRTIPPSPPTTNWAGFFLARVLLEDRSVAESPDVVDRDSVAILGFAPGTHDGVDESQASLQRQRLVHGVVRVGDASVLRPFGRQHKEMRWPKVSRWQTR